jgi:hypothetical protein
MVMMRFTVSKLKKNLNGAVVYDANGNILCMAYETEYGYVLNDSSNKATIGSLNFNKRNAVINIPEDETLVIKKKLFGRIKFPKESGYKKRGRMRKFNVCLYKDGLLSVRIEKIPDQKAAYYLDVWKGTNALRSALIAIALNDFFLRKKS